MNVLDLFSGIGGFSLGLERAGFRTVAFCEIEPYCRAVLAKHWPHVPCYGDIRELTAARLADDGITVDAICGGFPCQDVSVAGKGAGLAGERSGLWVEFARLIGEIRPRYAIVENVSALRSRGLGAVLGDLASLGYDAEWHCIPASYVGAPHRRDRVWIIAYPRSAERRAYAANGHQPNGRHAGREEVPSGSAAMGALVADSDEPRSQGRLGQSVPERTGERPIGTSGALADAARVGLEQRHTDASRSSQGDGTARLGWRGPSDGRWWESEPDVGRVVDGLSTFMDRVGGIPIAAAPTPHPKRSRSARSHRLRALGNAVVPQVVEMIGRAIMRLEST